MLPTVVRALLQVGLPPVVAVPGGRRSDGPQCSRTEVGFDAYFGPLRDSGLSGAEAHGAEVAHLGEQAVQLGLIGNRPRREVVPSF
jgi:hypothetical protein